MQFDGRKCNLNQKWDNDGCSCKCKIQINVVDDYMR